MCGLRCLLLKYLCGFSWWPAFREPKSSRTPTFPLKAQVLKMVFKYTSTRGLCIHLQIFWLVDMFLKNIEKWTFAEQVVDIPFLGLLKPLFYRKQNQLLPLAPWLLIWKRSVKAEGRGRRLGSRGWCLWALPWAAGLSAPFQLVARNFDSVCHWSPSWKWLYMWLPPLPFYKNLTYVLVVSCDFGWVVLICFPNNYSTSEYRNFHSCT